MAIADALRRAPASLLIAALVLAGCARFDAGAPYRAYSKEMTAQGMFRTERAPADAPYTAQDLIDNFLKVAFVPEEQLRRFYAKDRGRQRLLSKWRGAIHYAFDGDAVTPEDKVKIADLASELSAHSGLPIGPSAPQEEPNFVIFIMSPEARELEHRQQIHQNWYKNSIARNWVESSDFPCFAIYNTTSDTGGEIISATIFVKAEIEEPLRSACFVEEFTQTLGLTFDHDDIRPSIFNDDQEFISLTDHDRALIEILYDKRLTVGMTARQTKPVLRRIVTERQQRAS